MARPRYVLDTQLYIGALRSEHDMGALNAFHTTHTPFLYFSAVVAQELRAGTHGVSAKRLEKALFVPYERRGRLVTPSYEAWVEAGRVLGELVRGAAWKSVTRSFVNDVLLAMSCREAGAVLITANTGDFQRIAAVRTFEFVSPWPQ